jgi:hypothetical protein
MPKKKVISMLEFLRTGMFGGLAVGADVADLRPTFGKPVYIKENEDFRGKYVYEDVEFFYNMESQKVYGIIIFGFRDKDELGNFPRENKKFRIDPWILRWQSGLLNTRNALNSENLTFQQLPSTPGEGYETFRLKSGVEIIFSEEPEWVDGKIVYLDPPKIVYESIIKTSSEFVTTSYDLQFQ